MVFLLFITAINKKQASLPPPLPPPPTLDRRTCVIGKLNKEILSPEPSPALRPRLWSQFKSRRSPCQDLLGLPGCPCPRCCQPCPGQSPTPCKRASTAHTQAHTQAHAESGPASSAHHKAAGKFQSPFKSFAPLLHR